ncbi:hypothetical protein ACO0LM_11820 [Undibacterium sp. Di26W]|uniref:hypothetical protein n=1 Tax=Undibacterium sp. Di26W TaxID=3413035 RepID=UPI003BF1E727
MSTETGEDGAKTTSWQWWSGDQTRAGEYRCVGSDGTGQSYTFNVDSLFMQGSPAPVSFKLGGQRYFISNDNTLVRNPSVATGVGTNCGSVGTVANDFGVIMTSWAAGTANTPTEISGVDPIGLTAVADAVTFRTAVAPLFNGGFSISGVFQDGSTFSGTPDIHGIINNTSAGIFGNVDYNNGIVTLRFGTPVDDSHAHDPGVVDLTYLGIAGLKYVKTKAVQTDTLRYSAVGYSYLPLDQNILGLDPVRLPTDGKVPIFRVGNFVVVGHTATVGPMTVSNGQVINCARVRLSRVRVIDADGHIINAGYIQDLEAGAVEFIDVSGYVQPIKVEHRIEDMALVSDAQINGQLSLSRPLTHDYPVGSSISSALIIGDTHARVSTLFDQATFDNTWADTVTGSPAQATYNDTLFPILVTNKGALTERWALRFTNTTTFDIIGEHTGIIGAGNTGTDAAPNNPATGAPYFTVPAAGWGSGWAVGNVLRVNTVGATNPIWVARTILQGPPTSTNDSFTLLVRGDVDQP